MRIFHVKALRTDPHLDYLQRQDFNDLARYHSGTSFLIVVTLDY